MTENSESIKLSVKKKKKINHSISNPMTHDLPSTLFSKGRTFSSNKSTQKALVPQKKKKHYASLGALHWLGKQTCLFPRQFDKSLLSSTTLKSEQPITPSFSLKIGRIETCKDGDRHGGGGGTAARTLAKPPK